MNRVTELYNNLMSLVENSEISKFFWKDLTGPMGGTFRVFSYHYANYSDWLMDDALECRGIMFEMDGSTPVRIASRAMEKFFNLNENPLTMNIDLTKIAYSMDKADGSLVSSYLDDGHLYLKSKTSVFSEQAQAANLILNSEAYSALRVTVEALAKDNYTVNFEYVAPENRVVLSYFEPALIVLNVRENTTGEYIDYGTLFADSTIRPFLVKVYPVENPESWVEEVRAEEGIEGFVAVLESGQKFKLKTAWYTALHHTKDSITSNEKLYASIVNAAADDLRSLFMGDEYAISKIDAFEEEYLQYLRDSIEFLTSFYSTWRGYDRKTYAINAKTALNNNRLEHIFSILMNMYTGTMDNERMLKELEASFLRNWSKYVPRAYEKEIVISEE